MILAAGSRAEWTQHKKFLVINISSGGNRRTMEISVSFIFVT